MCSTSLQKGATAACLRCSNPGARRARSRAVFMCFIDGSSSVLSQCSSACCPDTFDSLPALTHKKKKLHRVMARVFHKLQLAFLHHPYLMFGSLKPSCLVCSCALQLVPAQRHGSSVRTRRGRRHRGNPCWRVRRGREGTSLRQLRVRNEVPSAWMGRTSERKSPGRPPGGP